MNGRERFLAACEFRNTDRRPPVWLMRQAGRALPEYRDLKSRHDFLELVHTPHLAVEATLQPIRRFGFDAAVIFSDILVVPEALGQPYRFRDSGGISMDFAITSRAVLDGLSLREFHERSDYLMKALALARARLGGETALLGFAGSPWTLASFMIEGGGTRDSRAAHELRRKDPGLFEALMAILTEAVTMLLMRQIDAGADAVQIFDTLAGTMMPEDYWDLSGKWIAEILRALGNRSPAILFAKGGYGAWDGILRTGARALSLDHTIDLAAARRKCPDLVLQGNIDPELLCGAPGPVRAATAALLSAMSGDRGHIVNLGHGVTPAASLECIAALVDTVRSWGDNGTDDIDRDQDATSRKADPGAGGSPRSDRHGRPL